MITLPPAQVGPYVRALYAAMHALAPNTEYVPLAAAAAHLRALDPELSGDLCLPGQVQQATGMPSFPWLQRAASEQILALQQTTDPTDEQVQRALELDDALGARMRDRRALRRHLRSASLVPASHLAVAVRRLGTSTDFRLVYDHTEPLGLWSRVTVEVSAPGTHRDVGPLHISEEGRVTADEGLRHLLARYAMVPLLSLRSQLAAGIGAQVVRVSRGRTGPFWFPGVDLPPGVPAELGQGLMLHLSIEVVGTDVHRSHHGDPLLPAPEGHPPEGFGHYTSRRFAASPPVVATLRPWLDQRQARCEVVEVG